MKNLIGSFCPNLDSPSPSPNFLWILPLLVSRHCSKTIILCNFLKETHKPNLKKWHKKSNFWSDFGQHLGPQFFFRVLPLIDFRHCCKLSLYAIPRKTNERNLRICQKKLTLGSILAHLANIWAPKKIFLWVVILQDVRYCCKLSLYATSRKSKDPNSRKLTKTSFWVQFRSIGPKIRS